MGLETLSLASILAIGTLTAGATAGVMALTGKKESPSVSPDIPTDTGSLTQDEITASAKKRLFRSGIMYTSPTGLGGGTEPTAAGKLK